MQKKRVSYSSVCKKGKEGRGGDMRKGILTQKRIW